MRHSCWGAAVATASRPCRPSGAPLPPHPPPPSLPPPALTLSLPNSTAPPAPHAPLPPLARRHARAGRHPPQQGRDHQDQAGQRPQGSVRHERLVARARSSLGGPAPFFLRTPHALLHAPRAPPLQAQEERRGQGAHRQEVHWRCGHGGPARAQGPRPRQGVRKEGATCEEGCLGLPVARGSPPPSYCLVFYSPPPIILP